MSDTPTTEEILAQRRTTHGEYAEHARCTQSLLRTLQAERRWPDLSDMQKETAHMICHKLARIVTGDPNQPDHYDDIAGYARLISQRLARAPSIFSLGDDVLAALARGWSTTLEGAATRLTTLGYGQPPATAAPAPAMQPPSAPAADPAPTSGAGAEDSHAA